MKLHPILIVGMLVSSGLACAADSGERNSPVDNNAKCMDRTVDASSGNCVVKDEGRPRRTYPPRPPAKNPPSRPGASSSSTGSGAAGGK
ncbi:MAG: hypothetical protein JWN94_2146 [Betaproteobacteria bacterium]|nr:hypothetical protein [Betaproteobacteria bacterium]